MPMAIALAIACSARRRPVPQVNVSEIPTKPARTKTATRRPVDKLAVEPNLTMYRRDDANCLSTEALDYVGSAPITVQQMCEGLSRAKMDEFVQNSSGKRQLFFRHIQSSTLPFAITGKDFGAQRAVFNLTARPKLLFVGDSILREVTSVMKEILPNATMSQVLVWRTGDALASYNEAAHRNGDAWLHRSNFTITARNWVKEHTAGYRVDGSCFAGPTQEREFLTVLLGFVAPEQVLDVWLRSIFGLRASCSGTIT